MNKRILIISMLLNSKGILYGADLACPEFKIVLSKFYYVKFDEEITHSKDTFENTSDIEKPILAARNFLKLGSMVDKFTNQYLNKINQNSLSKEELENADKMLNEMISIGSDYEDELPNNRKFNSIALNLMHFLSSLDYIKSGLGKQKNLGRKKIPNPIPFTEIFDQSGPLIKFAKNILKT